MVNFRPKQLRNHTRLGSKAPKGGEYIFANAYIGPICKGGPLIYWSDVLGEQGRIKEQKKDCKLIILTNSALLTIKP